MKKDLTIGGIGARSTSVRRRIMKRVCKENVSGVNLVMSDIADISYFIYPEYSISFGKLKQSIVIKDGQTLNLKPFEVLFVETSKSITNNGSINLSSDSQIYIADFIDDHTPPNSGGGSLVNNGNLIISSDSYMKNVNTLINNNVLINDSQLEINSRGAFTNNGSLTNTKVIYVSNGGTIINNNVLINNSTLVIDSIGAFTNNGSLTNTQTIYVSNGGTMINTIGTITNTGIINIADGSTKTGTDPEGNPTTFDCGFGNFDASGSYAGQPIWNNCP